MKLNINITGAAATRDKLAALADRLRDLNPAYSRSALVVLTAAQGRIRADGPGWWPTVETEMGSPLQRTGALFRSLTMGDSSNLQQQLPNGIRVGTALKTPDGKYNIGVLMQYGRKAITAKPGKTLSFVVNGKRVFVKSVGAAPPRPFLFIDEKVAQQVAGVFAARIRGEE